MGNARSVFWRARRRAQTGAAIALQIQGDVGVADFFQGLGHAGDSAIGQEFWHFLGADFDAGQVEDSGWLRVES